MLAVLADENKGNMHYCICIKFLTSSSLFLNILTIYK